MNGIYMTDSKVRRLAIAFVAMKLFATLEETKACKQFKNKEGKLFFLVPKKVSIEIKALNDALNKDDQYLLVSGALTPTFVASAKTMESDDEFITPESWFEAVKRHLYDVWQSGCKLEGFHQRFFFVIEADGVIQYINKDHYDGETASSDVIYPLMLSVIRDNMTLDILE